MSPSPDGDSDDLIVEDDASDSPLDGIMLGGDSEVDESGEGGLELDDSQADEIRDIFLTTLPQYLEPIEQMIEQVFADGEPDEEMRHALEAAVASISEAASRIGIEDVWRELERMGHHIGELSEGADVGDVHAALQEGLASIRVIASGGQEDRATESVPPSPTLFAVLKDAPDVDAAVLEKFTLAGLLTVDQVTSARLDEIIAVTGLGADVVRTVLDALGVIKAAPSSVGDSDTSVAAQVTAQVEAEVALEEGRARNTRLRAEVRDLESELQTVRERRDALGRDLITRQDDLTAQQFQLERLRKDSQTADRQRSRRFSELEQAKGRLASQRQDTAAALAAEAKQAEEASDLVDRVRRLLERYA